MIFNKSKFISIATLILSSFILLFSYKQYDEYISVNDKYNDIKRSMEEELEMYIYSLLNENSEKAELYLGEITNEVIDDIHDEYGKNLDGLEYDIKHPSRDSKLTEIFDRNLSNIYVNKNSNPNKPFVISQDKVLWDRSLGYDHDTTNEYLTLDDFIKEHYNPILSSNAIHSLLNVNQKNSNFIFWEVLPNRTKDHKIINDMDISNLIEVYRTEGIDGIKSYSLLVPTYIYKDSDIFGNKDIDSLGFKTDNDKMIVVQRLNVYDILKEDLYRITTFENEIEKLEEKISEINNKKVYNMLESIGWIIVFISISAILQKRINNRNE